MVPKGGLEPPRVTSHAPQTCASASSATSAKGEKFSKVAADYSRNSLSSGHDGVAFERSLNSPIKALLAIPPVMWLVPQVPVMPGKPPRLAMGLGSPLGR